MVKKWEKIGSEIIYQDHWVKLRHDQVMINDESVNWTVVEELDGGAVVAVTEDNKLVLIKENRVGVGKILLHLPAGYFDMKGKSKEEIIRKELLQETGYRAGKIEFLTQLYRAPSRQTQKLSYYFATDLKLEKQDLESTEDIDVVLVDFDEVLAMIDRGEIKDMETVLALLFVERRIRSKK